MFCRLLNNGLEYLLQDRNLETCCQNYFQISMLVIKIYLSWDMLKTIYLEFLQEYLEFRSQVPWWPDVDAP